MFKYIAASILKWFGFDLARQSSKDQSKKKKIPAKPQPLTNAQLFSDDQKLSEAQMLIDLFGESIDLFGESIEVSPISLSSSDLPKMSESNVVSDSLRHNTLNIEESEFDLFKLQRRERSTPTPRSRNIERKLAEESIQSPRINSIDHLKNVNLQAQPKPNDSESSQSNITLNEAPKIILGQPIQSTKIPLKIKKHKKSSKKSSKTSSKTSSKRSSKRSSKKSSKTSSKTDLNENITSDLKQNLQDQNIYSLKSRSLRSESQQFTKAISQHRDTLMYKAAQRAEKHRHRVHLKSLERSDLLYSASARAISLESWSNSLDELVKIHKEAQDMREHFIQSFQGQLDAQTLTHVELDSWWFNMNHLDHYLMEFILKKRIESSQENPSIFPYPLSSHEADSPERVSPISHLEQELLEEDQIETESALDPDYVYHELLSKEDEGREDEVFTEEFQLDDQANDFSRGDTSQKYDDLDLFAGDNSRSSLHSESKASESKAPASISLDTNDLMSITSSSQNHSKNSSSISSIILRPKKTRRNKYKTR